MTYGGIDTENCGSIIAYQPLSSVSFFQFTVSSISYGSYSNAKTYQAFININIGGYAISGPQAVIESMAKLVGAVWNE